ncbi:cell division protein ZapA [Rubellimicrobium aerolatum]|uniref:Cell division protein ZapA n=1 Tax=Rubellimicrobium aerolatum TaxID=490979 RepID=A0ABW0SC17_9RHOB|nr:cell division protein ZapA [Rubellimicrobium aerolatum]MBP1805989.1 cell division protein ZapA [Rubellimicrobium aerolatum]
MPQVEIVIGGRSFEVACQPGEEPYLRSAAAMLDAEASSLSEHMGRMPEGKMLLMAGLLLADKTTGLEERLRESEARAAELEARVKAGPERIEIPVEVPVEVRVEVPVIPAEVRELFAEVADEADALSHAVRQLLPEAAREPAPTT